MLLGRISYLNVLPIYYPLEQNIIAHHFQFVYGSPAELNGLMAQGELDISATSSIEYARNYKDYYLVPNLAIGSQGPVQSVLLLSQVPLNKLENQVILVSAQTHTSAILLKLLLQRHYHLSVSFETGNISSRLDQATPPLAFLAIGDEALQLRYHPAYPYTLDLGQAWMEWTNLPFIFGVWVVNKSTCDSSLISGCCKLLQAKDWGQERTEFFSQDIARQGILDCGQLRSYFQGLVYDLQSREQEGLQCFFRHLYEAEEIPEIPPLQFCPLSLH
jgi:chorismate dehydratase